MHTLISVQGGVPSDASLGAVEGEKRGAGSKLQCHLTMVVPTVSIVIMLSTHLTCSCAYNPALHNLSNTFTHTSRNPPQKMLPKSSMSGANRSGGREVEKGCRRWSAQRGMGGDAHGEGERGCTGGARHSRKVW